MQIKCALLIKEIITVIYYTMITTTCLRCNSMYLHYVCNHTEAKGNFEERIILEKTKRK